MKVVKIILKKYKLFIIGVLLGSIITGGGVYASTVGASNVSYSNSSSGLSATNVQGAIDTLYQTANTKLTKLRYMYCYNVHSQKINTTDCNTSNYTQAMANCVRTCQNNSTCKNEKEKEYGGTSEYCFSSVISSTCNSNITNLYNSCISTIGN